MTGKTVSTGVRRVLAAYDAMTSDEASLAILAEMAAQLQAELELLFVEDMELVKAAGLAPALQINLRTAAAGPLSLTELEAEMRAAETRLRRRLSQAAAQRNIRWSFRTVRGEAVDEVLLASRAADLLVLRHRRSWARCQSAIREPAAFARQTRHSVLLLEHGARPPSSVDVLFRPGEQCRRALALAARLAAAGDQSLEILATSAELVRAATDEAEALAGASGATSKTRYRVTRLAGDDVLSEAMERARRHLLVIGADDPILRGADDWNRLIGTASAVLLVR